jgi:xanthine dehydrogenase accessory factor
MTDQRPEQFYSEIVTRLREGQPFALATVVHTSGSTPQKAGARAIFLPDGRVLGTLGGGCMEMESRRRALELIQSPASAPPSPVPDDSDGGAQPLLLDLHLDDDFGWDDGLICGGSAQIFIQPLASRVRLSPLDVYDAAIALKAERRRGMLAMVIAASSAADIGRALLVTEEGPPLGALSDAGLMEELTAATRGLLEEGGEAPRRLTLETSGAVLYVEPILPRPVLLIMGAGHISTALTPFAARIGFEVVVVDDRASFANRERLPDADQVIVDSVVEVARRWPKTPETYVVLVTRGHRNDAVALREVIGTPCAYIGMIGSRRKVLTIYDEFLAEGIATPEQLARVHAPIGLDIGALTVDEIAVSIAAELIAIRRGGARHADRHRAGGGGIPANGDAEAALAVRERERDRAGRPLAASLPDRRGAGRGGPPRG